MATAIANFDPQVARDFRPSADQRRLLNMIHDYPSIRTVREFCEACDIGRRTYYNWCKNPHFRLWFATVWSARILTEGTTLINQARAKASYKFSYWKALADLTFDPRGLALLQKWQQAMFSLDGSAFDCGPEADPTYDFHFDPTSEADDGKPPQAPLAVPPATVAALETPAETGTFQAKLSNDSIAAQPAMGSVSSLPTPVAVARVFRRALAPSRYSCIAHRQSSRTRTRKNRLTIHTTAQPKPSPQHNLNCLTETVSGAATPTRTTARSEVRAVGRKGGQQRIGTCPVANRLISTSIQFQKPTPEQRLNCLTETIPANPSAPIDAQRGRGAEGPHARASISGWRGEAAPGPAPINAPSPQKTRTRRPSRQSLTKSATLLKTSLPTV